LGYALGSGAQKCKKAESLLSAFLYAYFRKCHDGSFVITASRYNLCRARLPIWGISKNFGKAQLKTEENNLKTD
jgi:hypothetical protein